MTLTTGYGGVPIAVRKPPSSNTRIGFSTPKKFNPVSWLVKQTSRSTVSHCFFVYHDRDWDSDMVMEAHELGFRLIPLAHFEKQNEIIASFVPVVPVDDGVKFVALEYLGSAYDFAGGFLLLLWRWFGRKWRNPMINAKAIVCSEAVVIALQRVGYPGAAGLTQNDVMPQDLLEFFKAEAVLRGVP